MSNDSIADRLWNLMDWEREVEFHYENCNDRTESPNCCIAMETWEMYCELKGIDGDVVLSFRKQFPPPKGYDEDLDYLED